MKELVPMNDYGIFANSHYEAMVDSRFVAEIFEKEHRNVLQAIKNLLEERSGYSVEFRRLNFKQSEYMNDQHHKQPCYVMTRDGFTALVMGFTGARANQFKEAYIRRFNEMEAQILMLQTLREQYRPLTDAIQDTHDNPQPYDYSNEADLLNRIVTGKTARKYREEKNIAKSESIRPYLSGEQAELMDYLQRVDVGLIYSVPNYQERRQKLEWCAMKWHSKRHRAITLSENDGQE
jgi:Rha family phage regulatory protein